KARTKFVCQSCGFESPQTYGRCPGCGEWNTLVETMEAKPTARDRRPVAPLAARPTRLLDVASAEHARHVVPMEEFNRVLGGGLVPGSLVLVGGDPGIGKCVTGDTRVLDPATGAYLPISVWANEEHPVLAVDDESLRLDQVAVSAFHERGIRPVVDVVTGMGRTLRCTPDHPVLTPEGWRPVGQLAPGDRVAAPRALPYFGSLDMPEHQVKLIAYILSDGSAHSATTITTALAEVEEDIRQIAAAFQMRVVRYSKPHTKAVQLRLTSDKEQRANARQEVAGVLRSARARAGQTWQSWSDRAEVSYDMLNQWRRGTCVPSIDELQRLADAVDLPLAALAPTARDLADMTTPIARFLTYVGLRYSRAADKAVPACIFQLPREQLALFLRTLFTCDGSVFINQQDQPGVSYSTISHQLATDVQHLLLRFGLIARLRTKRSRVSGRAYTAYELQLLGVANVQRFLAEIGILGRAAARARIAELEPASLPSTRVDTIPTGTQFWAMLDTARRAAGFDDYRVLSRHAGATIRNRRHDRPLARATVVRLAEVLDEPRLRSLAFGDIYWDEIESISLAGEAPVFDLTVPGKANFVANDLVIHNSTLLLQTASQLAERIGTVLYVSAEESAQQVRLRADRLGLRPESLFVLSETNLDSMLVAAEQLDPGLLIVDSIQTVYLDDLTSAAGSVSQVRECTSRLMQFAKPRGLPVLIVGHVTKEGAIAGPRVLEHMVDAVLYLEGDRYHQYRVLRAVKNRFGSTDEVGVFEMADIGMREVRNPSEAFLMERDGNAAGSAVAVTIEGTRPILLEVQGLTTASSFGQPRRTANGFDSNRLQMLVAVLSKRVGLG
ncbi:MAG TPA: LAGLIDADG family homing endonuclease, partial [Nitrolancea sp.]|nr:LAGLIDADG family homing endonuclease [Nitrolancea sp.]